MKVSIHMLAVGGVVLRGRDTEFYLGHYAHGIAAGLLLAIRGATQFE